MLTGTIGLGTNVFEPLGKIIQNKGCTNIESVVLLQLSVA